MAACFRAASCRKPAQTTTVAPPSQRPSWPHNGHRRWPGRVGRLIVLVRHVILAGIQLHAVPGALVEGLVLQLAHVSDKGQLILAVLRVMESGMSLADVSVVVAGSLVPASVSSAGYCPAAAASPRTITEAKRSARIFFILFISSVSMDWFGCVQGIFLQPFNGIITLIYPAIKSANETPSLFDKIDNLLFPCSKAARQKLHCAREYAIMFW